MPEKSRLTELAEHRKLLLTEAELHRSLIAMEVETLRATVAELDSARQRITRNPWVLAGSAVTGWLAFRHWRKLTHWTPAAFTVFQWVKAAFKK